MGDYRVNLCGAGLLVRPSGALYWEAERLLAISDLHLGRSERIARLGGALLPPYEVEETLLRLDAEIAAVDPLVVVCLGDSFDDLAAANLPEPSRLWVLRMMAGRRWIWITGNHDPAPVALGGEHHGDFRLGSLVFRHIAQIGALGEISGHYHPKIRLAGQRLACFLCDRARLILPAFGTYTGGMDAHRPEVLGLMGPGAIAILTGKTTRAIPFKR
jgi:uncharacterized protein